MAIFKICRAHQETGILLRRYSIHSEHHVGVTALREILTVASRPKFLQNNTKPAPEKNCWPRKIGGRMAAVFEKKQPKTGRKNI
jgi:hypothetical protein